MENKKSYIPFVIWAQRSHVIYVTFCVENVKNPDIKIERRRLTFRGFAGEENKLYEICIPLYAIIDNVNSITFKDGKYAMVELQKLLTDTTYWPRLTLDDVKYHWLKIDFARWKDEEDEIGDNERMDAQINVMFKNSPPRNKITFYLGDSEDEEPENDKNEEIQELDINEWRWNITRYKNL